MTRPLAAGSYMAELCQGLGWSPWRGIAMLWGYFDESGEHDRITGNLTRLTVGGALATAEAWAALSMEWAATLRSANISAFHMTDFEGRKKPPYDAWSEPERRRILSALLDIAIRHVPTFIGYTVEPAPDEPALKYTYESNIGKFLKDAARGTFHSQEPLTLVFAAHPEIKAARIGRYFDLWDDGDGRLKFGGVGDPNMLCPLQVADIVAYELHCFSRKEQPEGMRYPLKRLSKEAKSCTLTYFNPAHVRRVSSGGQPS